MGFEKTVCQSFVQIWLPWHRTQVLHSGTSCQKGCSLREVQRSSPFITYPNLEATADANTTSIPVPWTRQQ